MSFSNAVKPTRTRTLSLIVVWTAFLAASSVAAQERVFVAQQNPAQVHSFQFTGTTFIEDDLDPNSARLALQGGIDPVGLALTPRQFVIASGFQSLALNTLDRATGLELPRTRTTAALPTGVLLTTAGGDFAFVSGKDTNQTPVLSIVDLRPGASAFLTEVASVSFGGTAPAGKGITAMELDPSRQLLYVAIQWPGPPAPRSEIRVVDISTPSTPVLKAFSVSFSPSPPMNALRRFSSLGDEFLAAGGAFRIFKVAGDGSLTLFQPRIGSINLVTSTQRLFRDLRFVTTPSGDRLFAVTNTFTTPTGDTTIDEVLELDMRRVSAAAPFPGTLLHSYLITAAGDNGLDSLALSETGAYLYILDTEARSGAPLIALSRDKLMAGQAPLLATAAIAGVNLVASAYGLAVGSVFVPPAGGPQIASIDVDGVAGAVLVNNQPHTLTLHGSGLGGVTHVFMGLTRATVLAASDTLVTATVPALAPAATAAVVAIDSNGAVGRGSVTISNAPTFLPAYRVYATGLSGNEIAILNAATKTEVTSTFPTGPGAADPVISADGRFLFATDFRASDVSVHSIVADPSRGYGWNDRIAGVGVGLAPRRQALNSVRHRLYVPSIADAPASVDTIAVIDVDPNSPSFLQEIDTDGDPTTTDPGAPAGITRIKTRLVTDSLDLNGAIIRALAITPDGRFLYAARQASPHLLVIDVQTDVVGSVTPITISGLESAFGRSDGLAVSPNGQRLYFTTLSDTALRIFDITVPTSPVSLTTVPFPGTPAGDVRRIQVRPDGKFVYVSSRTRGAVDVLDTATSTFVATIPTAIFSGEPAVTPDGQFVFVAGAERDEVLTIDAREMLNGASNPNFHKVVASTAGALGTIAAAVSPGLATPTGASIAITPAQGVTITFDQVTAAGNTTVTSSNTSDVLLPEGFAIQGLPVFYEVRTTAGFARNIQVCLRYDDTGLTPDQEAALRVLHAENGAFIDRTASIDTVNNVICASVTSFSAFAIVLDRRFDTLLTIIHTSPGIADPLRNGLSQLVEQAASAKRAGNLGLMRTLLLAFEERVEAQSKPDKSGQVLIDPTVGARLLAVSRSLRASAV